MDARVRSAMRHGGPRLGGGAALVLRLGHVGSVADRSVGRPQQVLISSSISNRIRYRREMANSRQSEIGRLVREARQRSGVSQRSLARRAGTSQAAISRIERGLEQPTFERLEQIFAGLGWRPAITLEPLAEHDAEPRRIFEEDGKTPSDRLAAGLTWSAFLRELKLADRAG
jgi:transcriptional regulator with XRE-family HTH domain